ncbi:hypothetical protein ACJMK2_006678, partial [Sinanodonta woodiana]
MSYIEYVVEVVPKSWIEHTDQELIFANTFILYLLASVYCCSACKTGELPDKEKRTNFNVRIFVTTWCYQKALLKAKQAEETSNVELDEEHKPSPKKRPQHYIHWSDEENGDGAEKRRKPQIETLSAHSSQQRTTIFIHYFQLSVLRKLDTVIENQQEQLNEYSDEIIASPIDSVEELEGFCCKLKENPELIKKMIFYLSSLGGSHLKDSGRRMMNRLGTKRLWSLYGFKGRKGKKAFQDILLCRVLIN